MKNWISFPRVEGVASRQAHADLPPGTYEREMGKEGFFGPSTQLYHAHPPTAWTSWEGPLRPRAFDLAKINALAASPWEADAVLSNAHLRFRQWRTEGRMDRLVRNGDGRLATPFNSLSGVDPVDASGHRIFVFSGTAPVGASTVAGTVGPPSSAVGVEPRITSRAVHPASTAPVSMSATPIRVRHPRTGRTSRRPTLRPVSRLRTSHRPAPGRAAAVASRVPSGLKAAWLTHP